MTRNQTNQHWLIVIEGSDGSGKSTLLNHIAQRLQTLGCSLVQTREPGGSSISEALRELILAPTNTPMQPLTELLLIEAARHEHVVQTIKPALDQGKVVLCDRFTDSTTAYQGYGRGLDLAFIHQLNTLATSGITPCLNIWLKVTPSVAFERTKNRGEQSRLDAEKEEFRNRVFQGFSRIFSTTETSETPSTRIVLDAHLSPDAIAESLWQHPLWVAFEKSWASQ